MTCPLWNHLFWEEKWPHKGHKLYWIQSKEHNIFFLHIQIIAPWTFGKRLALFPLRITLQKSRPENMTQHWLYPNQWMYWLVQVTKHNFLSRPVLFLPLEHKSIKSLQDDTVWVTKGAEYRTLIECIVNTHHVFAMKLPAKLRQERKIWVRHAVSALRSHFHYRIFT